MVEDKYKHLKGKEITVIYRDGRIVENARVAAIKEGTGITIIGDIPEEDKFSVKVWCISNDLGSIKSKQCTLSDCFKWTLDAIESGTLDCTKFPYYISYSGIQAKCAFE